MINCASQLSICIVIVLSQICLHDKILTLFLQILQIKLFNLCINNIHIIIFIVHRYCIFAYLYLHHDSQEDQRDLHALQHKLKSMLCRDCCQFLNQPPYMRMEQVELVGWSCILRLLKQYIVCLSIDCITS